MYTCRCIYIYTYARCVRLGYGMIWYSTVQYGMEWNGKERCGMPITPCQAE